MSARGQRFRDIALHAALTPRQITERLAKLDPAVRAGLHDQPGRFERRRDVGRAAERPRFARDGRDLAGAVDAVLDGQDRPSRVTKHRPQQRQRGGLSYVLTATSTRSTAPTRVGILLGACAGAKIAQRRAPDFQAALADGVQVRAAGNEGHLVAGLCQPGPVVAADRAGTENRDFHVAVRRQ